MIFLDLYYKLILYFEFFFKLSCFYLFYSYSFFFFQFIEFVKYNVYIFSRFFRNIRLNFLFFNLVIVKKLNSYLNNRKKVLFLNSFFINLSGIFFFFNIEFLLFEIFRIFSKYSLSLYLNILKKKDLICFFWNDIYSNLVDLNDLIIYRDLFIFKYELPRIIYYFYFFFFSIKQSLLFLSFLGYKFFFKKRFFRFKFFSKIL